jgi:Uri superfamily endonuclease
MKGVYILIIQVTRERTIRIKALGKFRFKEGTWLYIGSAMGHGSTSLENRISRHFRREKAIHWHIDVLLQHPTILKSAIWAESNIPIECNVAQNLENEAECIPGPAGFGASDCKNHCTSHLLYCTDSEKAQDIITRIFTSLGLESRVTYDGSISL